MPYLHIHHFCAIIVAEVMKLPHIMIIDDDIHINVMIEETLTAEGYTVSKAFSGTEALLLLQKQKPDLILLDLMLPGLTGEELLPKIKDIPVIVVSAKADVADKVGLLIGGAADYITKPFDIKELLARITVQLRKTANSYDPSVLTFRDLSLNCDTLTAVIADTEIHLTRTECAILKLLIRLCRSQRRRQDYTYPPDLRNAVPDERQLRDIRRVRHEQRYFKSTQENGRGSRNSVDLSRHDRRG